jgi:ribose transport system permease protein/putative xylitol transport system permease protein
MRDLAKRNVIPTVLILLVLGLAIASPSFRSTKNLWNILDQNVIPELVACGMLCIMLTGGFDLSVGASGAIAAVTAATVSIHMGILAGIVVGLAAALAVGLVNGLCISFLNVNPFVTTLGTMTLWYGVLNLRTAGSPVSGTPPGWTGWGLGSTGPVPNPVFVGLAALLLTYFLLRYTILGGHIYAVGSNMAGAARAGVAVRLILCTVYVVGAVLAGLAGVITVAQSGVGNPSTGTDWPLAAIAAIVIGGTRLSGGVGGVKSVVVGTFLITVLSNALTLYNVSPFYVPIMTGIIVIVAVAAAQHSGRSMGSLVKSTQL